MDNTKLIAEARTQVEYRAHVLPSRLANRVRRGEGADQRTALLAHLADALEAAEAELTRRDKVIAEIGAWRAGPIGRRLMGDPAAMDFLIDGLLAAAPVSLEAVKAEAHDHEFEDRCYCGLTAADHFAEGNNRV